MWAGGDPQVVVILAVAVLIAAAMAVIQGLASRRRLELVRAAIEADQPEVAKALLGDRWSAMAQRAGAIALIAIGLMVVGAFHSMQLSGLYVLGSVVLLGSVPVAVYAMLRGLGHEPATTSGCLALGLSALSAGIVAMGLGLMGFYVPARARSQTRSVVIRQDLQHLNETQDFEARVRRLTGSPPGTRNPVIGGNRAEPCLSGSSFGMQSCGSTFHPQLRFSTLKQSYLNVYYIPATQQYLVIGTARVRPSGKVVTDGSISVQEALGTAAPERAGPR